MRLTSAQKAMLRRLAKEHVGAAYLNKRVLAALRAGKLGADGGTIGNSWVCLTSRGRLILEEVLQ